MKPEFPFALSLSKGVIDPRTVRSWFDKLTTNGWCLRRSS